MYSVVLTQGWTQLDWSHTPISHISSPDYNTAVAVVAVAAAVVAGLYQSSRTHHCRLRRRPLSWTVRAPPPYHPDRVQLPPTYDAVDLRLEYLESKFVVNVVFTLSILVCDCFTW